MLPRAPQTLPRLPVLNLTAALHDNPPNPPHIQLALAQTLNIDILIRHRVPAQTPPGIRPAGLERKQWMARCEHTDRNNDHSALEDHERDLLVRQRTMEAAGQLRDAEARADEDAQRRDAQACQEGLEDARVAQPLEVRVQPRRAAERAPGELGAEGGEEREREDLEGESCDHDVDAHLVLAGRVGARGDGAADGLQHQRDEVAGYEGEGVGAGTEAGEVFAVDDYDAGQAEVDGGGEEGWGDGESDERPGGWLVGCS